LESTSDLLGWDQETYLPAEAIPYRAEQGAYLAGQAHRIQTSQETGELLASYEGEAYSEESPEAVNLRQWRWRYDRALRLPSEFVRAGAHGGGRCLGKGESDRGFFLFRTPPGTDCLDEPAAGRFLWLLPHLHTGQPLRGTAIPESHRRKY